MNKQKKLNKIRIFFFYYLVDYNFECFYFDYVYCLVDYNCECLYFDYVYWFLGRFGFTNFVLTGFIPIWK